MSIYRRGTDDDEGLGWGPSSASLGLQKSWADNESDGSDLELLTAKAEEACDMAGISDALRALYKLNLAASIIQAWPEALAPYIFYQA
mmetsp:Transcript_23892/g.66292  ORF Transcript_23892/g.66292 Transcript_23892/m.66292 type:complete len:88 (+) Transcript_23892:187-450(+)